MKSQSEIARELALKAHAGQFRRDGATPYFNHVDRVGKSMRERGLKDELVAVGFGHDILEMSSLTAQDLLNAGLKQNVVDSIVAITKLDGEELEKYWTRVFNNFDALVTKMYDIQDNLSDSPTEKQKEKYMRAIDFFQSLGKDESVGERLAKFIL